MSHLENVQPISTAKQKLVISQKSVSVNVQKIMWQVHGRSNKRCDDIRCKFEKT